MKPLTSAEISGTWATLLLPLARDESIDWPRLEEEIDVLLRSGVSGIYSNGTAGEFHSQSEEEFDRLHALFAARCENARMAFQIGVCHPNAQASLSRLKRAAQLKPGALQVILPDWYPVTNEEAVAFLERMAEASEPIGLVLYNPPHAKRVLAPADFGELAAVAALIGIKVMDGDESWYRAMRNHAAKLSVFVPGHHLATGYRLGAAGSYSNVACLHPAGAQKWHELMKTDSQAALELEGRINKFLELIPRDYPNAAKDKLLTAIGGWSEIGTRLRWPYRWIPESEAVRLRPVAEQLLPELFQSG
jgi:dihydrodipicolinate synthase/N-acetylneuraminate lyase